MNFENTKSSEDRPKPVLPKQIDKLYNSIWRWHFYAGLLVMPILLVMAVTGAIYLFKPQLDPILYKDWMVVTPEAESTSYVAQMRAVVDEYPDARITKVLPAQRNDRATEFAVESESLGALSVYVNPYTAQVLGGTQTDGLFQEVVRDIHGDLFIGNAGDYLVEIASSWAVILVITGLYLWWPRGKGGWKKAFWPGFSTQNRRAFWRNIHTWVGSYTALLIVFLVISGLPWAGYWGDNYAKVWNRYPPELWNQVPQSGDLTAVLNKDQQMVPWAAEEIPLPESTPDDLQNLALTIDAVIAFATQEKIATGYNVSLPKGDKGVYTISVFPDDPWQQRTLHIDQYSGAVLVDLGWENYSAVPKLVELGIALHMGKYFGLPNQLLMLSACLAIIMLAVSSMVMWWQRRPSGFGLGAPPGRVKQMPIIIFMTIMGFTFPLAGVSMLIVLVLDFVILSRMPGLRLAFN